MMSVSLGAQPRPRSMTTAPLISRHSRSCSAASGGLGGALVPGAEPRVGGVHLGQLLGAEALGVLGREDAGVHRSLPGGDRAAHPTPPGAGNPGAAAAGVGAAEPVGSILIGGLHSIPAKNPHVCWPALLRLMRAMIPDRDR